MKKLINFIYALLRKAIHTSGPKLILFTLIAVVVIGGGKYFWKEKPIASLPESAISRPPFPAEEVKDTEETEEEEEDESEDTEYSSDQKSPWTLLQSGLPSQYFEPPAQAKRPTITIILTGLGLNKKLTEYVLTRLKGPFTLAFSPDSPNLDEQCRLASSLGFAPLVALPMEPYNYPILDPGPLTLLTGVPVEQNVKRTKEILNKSPKYTGIIGSYGSRFTLSKIDLGPVLNEIKSQGRIFIDPNTTLHTQVKRICESLEMPYHQVGITIPLTTSSDQDDEYLKKIIQSSKENGNIIINVPAIPEIVNRIADWIDKLKVNGIELVPVPNFTNTNVSSDTLKN